MTVINSCDDWNITTPVLVTHMYIYSKYIGLLHVLKIYFSSFMTGSENILAQTDL